MTTINSFVYQAIFHFFNFTLFNALECKKKSPTHLSYWCKIREGNTLIFHKIIKKKEPTESCMYKKKNIYRNEITSVGSCGFIRRISCEFDWWLTRKNKK